MPLPYDNKYLFESRSFFSVLDYNLVTCLSNILKVMFMMTSSRALIVLIVVRVQCPKVSNQEAGRAF